MSRSSENTGACGFPQITGSGRVLGEPRVNRRYVVTGCAGFIGSRVAAMLAARGDYVIGLDCLLPDLYPNAEKWDRLRLLNEYPNFQFHKVDLRTDSFEHLLVNADAVLHFAAMAGLAKSWTNPEIYEACNVLATQRLLDAVDSAGVRHLVHASTSSVYGRYALGNETTQLAPVSPYGETKLIAERSVQNCVDQSELSATILRYFSVYGPAQRTDMAYSKFCRAFLNNQEILITGDGSQRRSNTYLDDAARAAVLAVDQKTPSVTVNICGGESIALLEAVGVLADTLGVVPQYRFVDPARGDQAETKGDSTLARELLGWKPEVPVRQGLVAQANWEQSRARGPLILSLKDNVVGECSPTP